MASAGSLHPQVDVNYNEETRKNLKLANIGPLPTIKLDAIDIISDIWERPPDRDLHVFVGLLAAVGSSTLSPMAGECSIRLFALAQDIRRFRCLKVTSLLTRVLSENTKTFSSSRNSGEP